MSLWKGSLYLVFQLIEINGHIFIFCIKQSLAFEGGRINDCWANTEVICLCVCVCVVWGEGMFVFHIWSVTCYKEGTVMV